jgi:hypothetical protein
MTKRVVEHKIKLEKSVKIILGVLAFGVFLNAFAPAFSVREAYAQFPSHITVSAGSQGFHVWCSVGCQ